MGLLDFLMPLLQAVEAWGAYAANPSAATFAHLARLAAAAGVPLSPVVRRHSRLEASWRIRQHLALALLEDGEAAEALYHAQRCYNEVPTELPVRSLLAAVYERFRFIDGARSLAVGVLEDLLNSSLPLPARKEYERRMLVTLFRIEVFLHRDAKAIEALRELVDRQHPMAEGLIQSAIRLFFHSDMDLDLATRMSLWRPVGAMSEVFGKMKESFEAELLLRWRSRLVAQLRGASG